ARFACADRSRGAQRGDTRGRQRGPAACRERSVQRTRTRGRRFAAQGVCRNLEFGQAGRRLVRMVARRNTASRRAVDAAVDLRMMVNPATIPSALANRMLRSETWA